VQQSGAANQLNLVGGQSALGCGGGCQLGDATETR
jgi:hypothetical protein